MKSEVKRGRERVSEGMRKRGEERGKRSVRKWLSP